MRIRFIHQHQGFFIRKDFQYGFYKDEFFVRVCACGTLPETKNVSGSNFVDIGVVVDERLNRAVVVSAIDNIVKGAAGQAVQNMNLMFGLPEGEGLTFPGFYL